MEFSITGLPFSGKTTLLQSLSKQNNTSNNKKVKKNKIMLSIPDPRLKKLKTIYQSKKITYAQTLLTDSKINQFSSNNLGQYFITLKKTNVLIEVVRDFKNCMGNPNIRKDIETLKNEMILYDLLFSEEHLNQSKTQKNSNLLKECQEILNAEKTLFSITDSTFQKDIEQFNFLTAKPKIMLINSNKKNKNDSQSFDVYKEFPILKLNLKTEIESSNKNDLDNLIFTSYQSTNMINFFTAGKKEIRSWNLKQESPVIQAAKTIHSDMKKGFIRAEIIQYKDIIKEGSESAVKKAGLSKLVGKDYKIQDGDILNIKFNV